MSSIIFEGNTYTFGATVSANPGTGTTSYVFGGLSSGWTYGFIVWAFNGVGPSSIVGPTIKSTLSQQSIESREIISAFAYGWGITGSVPMLSYSLQYDSGSTLNIFYDSQFLSSEHWGFPGFTRTPYTELVPTGETGWHIERSTGFIFLSQNPVLETGFTYTVSWYQHTGSSSGMQFSCYGQGGGPDTVWVQQLLPQLGTGTTSSVALNLLGPTGGECGWIRYAVQFYASGQRRIFYLPFRNTNVSGNRGYILGSPQLERQT